jgi:hypothetical protein
VDKEREASNCTIQCETPKAVAAVATPAVALATGRKLQVRRVGCMGCMHTRRWAPCPTPRTGAWWFLDTQAGGRSALHAGRQGASPPLHTPAQSGTPRLNPPPPPGSTLQGEAPKDAKDASYSYTPVAYSDIPNAPAVPKGEVAPVCQQVGAQAGGTMAPSAQQDGAAGAAAWCGALQWGCCLVLTVSS